jgi:hypothetical protein
MSILSKLFGGGGGGGFSGSNPANAAQPYLDKIPQVGHDYYDPYITQGSTAGQTAQRQYDTLTNDPTGFINKLMEAYKPSEGYQFQKDLLTKEMGNTAAAGGIAGTPLDQMNQAEGVQGLLSKDMQQFLQNALGVYGTGLEGEEKVSGRGFDAAKNLADLLGGSLNQQAGLAFQGQQQQNTNKSGMLSALAKALGMGAGAFFGGAPGALIGGGLGSSMFGGG